jgi:hypothetical protein
MTERELTTHGKSENFLTMDYYTATKLSVHQPKNVIISFEMHMRLNKEYQLSLVNDWNTFKCLIVHNDA